MSPVYSLSRVIGSKAMQRVCKECAKCMLITKINVYANNQICKYLNILRENARNFQKMQVSCKVCNPRVTLLEMHT